MNGSQISSVIELLQELQDDSTVPRNVKLRLENTMRALMAECAVSLKVSKALTELDEAADDSNLESYTRTQIWNIVSLLESL